MPARVTSRSKIMSDMTPDDVAVLEAALAKMTPGEWRWEFDKFTKAINGEWIIRAVVDYDEPKLSISQEDARGIVLLRNLAPAILAAVKERDELRKDAQNAFWPRCGVGNDERIPPCGTCIACERDALAKQNATLRAALNRLASWPEGETVNSGFDSPVAAAIARAALA